MSGVLLVLSGPTCSGKDVVMRRLLKRNKKMQRLVTTNSRTKRPDEVEGTDYYFVLRKEFEKLIAEEAFFEWVEYRGEYRGGQIKHVKKALESGNDVIWRIDVRGVKNIYKKVKKMVPASVFVMLSSPLEVLKSRSELRKTEEPEWENWSMNRAKWELKQGADFDKVVINKEGELNKTVEEMEKIIEKVKVDG
ncbi:MAG: guanylate kinase [Patescibacteria group bacterium]|nr:guanylate kinase [Patescibacteria group bacterium]